MNLTQPVPGTLYAQLYDFSDQINTGQVIAKFPTDQWVQLEVFVSKSTAKKGRITVWQNGTLILDVQDVETILNANDSFQWCVGGASTALAPPLPIRVYVDDAAISTVQLGPNVVF